jgi:HEPN domain-containing protein
VSFEEAELLRLRAEAFLRNAERLYAEGEYDLAAFSIEQHCQPLLKTGAYPRTHSLIRLVRELAKVAEGAKRLLEDIVMLTKIEDAYIGSRYLPRRYEKEEVEAMLKYVKEKFRPVIDELWYLHRGGEKALEALRKYREAAEKVKEVASDIDILIVADIGKEEATLLKAEIYKTVDAPVEIHVATQEHNSRRNLTHKRQSF